MKRMNVNRRWLTAFGIAALAACWMAGPAIAPASASIIVSNLGQPQRSSGSIIHPVSGGKAVAFTMPAGSDYQLGDLTLKLDTYVNNPAATVSLYSNDGANTPGAKLLDFIAPVSLVNGLNVFTHSGSFTLTAATQYWVTVEDLTPNSSFVWQASNNATVASDIGATVSGRVYGSGSPGGWTTSSSVINYLMVEGTIVPEPATAALLAASGVLMLIGGRRGAMRPANR